jgi:hypothetical protein
MVSVLGQGPGGFPEVLFVEALSAGSCVELHGGYRAGGEWMSEAERLGSLSGRSQMSDMWSLDFMLEPMGRPQEFVHSVMAWPDFGFRKIRYMETGLEWRKF